MKGDTMVVKVTHSESKKYKILKIVLEWAKGILNYH
jgi:hypothetical protein